MTLLSRFSDFVIFLVHLNEVEGDYWSTPGVSVSRPCPHFSVYLSNYAREGHQTLCADASWDDTQPPRKLGHFDLYFRLDWL